MIECSNDVFDAHGDSLKDSLLLTRQSLPFRERIRIGCELLLQIANNETAEICEVVWRSGGLFRAGRRHGEDVEICRVRCRGDHS